MLKNRLNFYFVLFIFSRKTRWGELKKGELIWHSNVSEQHFQKTWYFSSSSLTVLLSLRLCSPLLLLFDMVSTVYPPTSSCRFCSYLMWFQERSLPCRALGTSKTISTDSCWKVMALIYTKWDEVILGDSFQVLYLKYSFVLHCNEIKLIMVNVRNHVNLIRFGK